MFGAITVNTDTQQDKEHHKLELEHWLTSSEQAVSSRGPKFNSQHAQKVYFQFQQEISFLWPLTYTCT